MQRYRHRTTAQLLVLALAGCSGNSGGSTAEGSSSGASTSATASTDDITPTSTGDVEPTGPASGSGTDAASDSTDPGATSSSSSSSGEGPGTGDDSETGGVALGPAVLKINVGGPAVADFLADDGPESPYRASPDTEIYAPGAVSPDASVPADLPPEVLQTGRVEPDELSGGTGQMRWSVPVEPGVYQLRLHFAGLSGGAGTRVLDLRVDGETVVAGLDVSALTAGDQASTVTVEVTADDWLDLELVRVPGSAMPTLAALELFGAGALRDAPAGTVRHITPAGGGSGASLDDAAALTALPKLIAESAPGDEVWIHAGLGDYMVGGEIVIAAGGEAGAPVVVRGVGDGWHDAGRPRLVGTRANPWVADGEEGGVVFRLNAGADHLRFVNLGFADQGNGCWRVARPVTDLQLENIAAHNVHRLFEQFVSGEGEAQISGLRLKDVSVRGYARAVARLQYDSSDIVLEDVFGDSEAQQYESFSTGVTFDGTAHDIVLRRSVMLNHQQLGGEGYWNADGFSSERDNHAMLFEDTFAAGNTDGGYDLKSSDTKLLRAVAVDNKRNFRIWGEVSMEACEGRDPFKRGGSGTQAQFHANPDSQVELTDCRFRDDSPATIVFDADDNGVATVMGGCAQHHPDADLQTIEPAASLTLVDVAESCR